MTHSLNRSFANPAKTQHYTMDGNGRDSYIFRTNGGFYPDRKTNGIEELGKFRLPLTKCRFICNC